MKNLNISSIVRETPDKCPFNFDILTHSLPTVFKQASILRQRRRNLTPVYSNFGPNVKICLSNLISGMRTIQNLNSFSREKPRSVPLFLVLSSIFEFVGHLRSFFGLQIKDFNETFRKEEILY